MQYAFVGRTMDTGEFEKGYRSLWDGKDFLVRLTGIAANYETINDEFFEKLLHAKDGKTVYTCGTASDVKGMDSGHAYTILGAREENGMRIVKIR